jgi:DNA-binding MarR family transcriptional regulator
MKSEAYRDLQLLDAIGEGAPLTQRALAKRLNVALGVTNLCLKRLARKGYIKVINVQPRRLKYLVTPKGISEKTRLTYEYVAHSFAVFRVARRHLAAALMPVLDAGYGRVALYGTGEAAELAYLSLHELGMEVVGIYGREQRGKTFLGNKVLGIEDLAQAQCDRILVTAFERPEAAVADLLAVGVPAERILTLRGPIAGAADLPDQRRTASSGLPDARQ